MVQENRDRIRRRGGVEGCGEWKERSEAEGRENERLCRSLRLGLGCSGLDCQQEQRNSNNCHHMSSPCSHCELFDVHCLPSLLLSVPLGSLLIVYSSSSSSSSLIPLIFLLTNALLRPGVISAVSRLTEIRFK